MAKTGRKATVALVAFMALGLAGRASGNDAIAKTEQPKPTIVLHVTNDAELSPEVIDAAKARVAAVYAVIGVRTVWDDRGMAVSRLENGELHVNVLLLPRDMKQSKAPRPGPARPGAPAQRTRVHLLRPHCGDGGPAGVLSNRARRRDRPRGGTSRAAGGRAFSQRHHAREPAWALHARAELQQDRGTHHPRGIDGDELTA